MRLLNFAARRISSYDGLSTKLSEARAVAVGEGGQSETLQ